MNPITDSKANRALPTIQVDACDKYLLDHFIDNALCLTFPVLEFQQPGSVLSDIILPALESNKAYFHLCLSISAFHLKATQRVRNDLINGDIMRHRYAAVGRLCEMTDQDTEHAKILEASLGMTFMQCSVGDLNNHFPDVPWHQNFRAAVSLINKPDLFPHFTGRDSHSHSRLSFNMAVASWIDILGATMLCEYPIFADTYRGKLIGNSLSGLSELMGCEDRIMYIISEIACLESLKQNGMDEVQLYSHIKVLRDHISLCEPPTRLIMHVYSSTGAIRPEQLNRNITTVFRLSARIYLCSLIPDFGPTLPSIGTLVDALCDAMEYIPGGPEGFDRSLVWPLLIAGSVSLPNTSFRTMLADRSRQLGPASDIGSFGRMKELLKDVWRINDDALEIGDGWIHWRDTMRRNGWDFLLI